MINTKFLRLICNDRLWVSGQKSLIDRRTTSEKFGYLQKKRSSDR